MEIKVLGDLTVRIGGAKLPLGTPKQQMVFAMLAVDIGRLVTVDELVDELWPAEPPRSAVPNVRTYAANLRRACENAAGGELAIVREQGGYRLSGARDTVDLIRLAARLSRARILSREENSAAAVPLLAEVVESWHGSLLTGLPVGPALAARREAAERERGEAYELLADLHLRAGRPDLAVALLRPYAARCYTREYVQTLLMRALIAADDLEGAVAVYHATRAALAEQLDVQPGQQLDQLYRLALGPRHGRSGRRTNPTAAPVGCPTPGSGRTVNWLPRAVSDFIGRDDVAAKLLQNIRIRGRHTSVVQVIDGMAGCGKTTLAVHLAKKLAPDYPDAQLFIDLRGHGDAAPSSRRPSS
ncbi:DNA-binding transcriptional activator of the SARP family [Micromonospora viridifaciens]|uniref:DNA-binding transcriptional activator of the SARP family n=1 Tax=Micromonospora viridifaciens TaxID=1881 RepID=A0A1C4UG40_MICVI|nr:BTAD domain-containing putative transcriptional regulator [Micromonospora viridifaciens]SCE70607.1 DNA-binding transcriptional activator of the SARP family [Micromonospora viridifaciens]